MNVATGLFRDRGRKAMALVAIAGALTVLFGLGAGAMSVPPAEVIRALFHIAQDGDLEQQAMHAVVFEIRLPRVVMTLFVGAGLAMAGAVLQSLFRNPLADPALIGVSTGAALAVAIVIVIGNQFALPIAAGHAARPLSACIGGIIATVVVVRLSRSDQQTDMSMLLLAGVAINSLCAAGLGLLLFVADDAQLRDITFWILGSTSSATWNAVRVLVPSIVVCGFLLWRLAPALDVISLGEATAGHLGVKVESVKRSAILFGAVIVGTTVAFCGAIGFIGLVVPHVWRLWIGPGHRQLLIGAPLLGAVLLLAADILARLVFAPAELPVGIVTSLLGAPFFIWLLTRKRGVIA